MSRLQIKNVTKTYSQGQELVTILDNISLDLFEGEVLALLGPSGCGKSTLMHIAGLLDDPSSGEVLINNISCLSITDDQKTKIRLRDIGFVYQFHHLLKDFTVLENLIIPQRIAGRSVKESTHKALNLLGRVGIEHKYKSLIPELSGGEQQRVAIARAMVNSPSIILADEPTGNLDPHTSALVFELFMSEVAQNGSSAIIVTHNHDLASQASRVINLNNKANIKI